VTELDLALARFHQGRFEYGGGLANHGPMAAEALEALSHEALIPGFAEVYAPRLGEAPKGEPIDPDRRDAALGNGADGDWAATFDRLGEEASWRELLVQWLPALIPGLFAAATHGALRTAHAARGAGRRESPERAREVGLGLGYWASHYRVLPGRPGSSPEAGLGPARLIASLEPVPLAERAPGFFDDAVGVLDGREDFARAIARLDLDAGDPSEMLSELCAAAAGLYLAHPEARIAYAHCVTAPSALRLLAGFVERDVLRAAVGHAVQAVAALHVTHVLRDVDAAPDPTSEVLRLADRPDEVRYRAACSAEEHAIKLAEACLREEAIRSDPRLRLAAADAAVAIGASAGSRGA